jgi:hypothetical protein
MDIPTLADVIGVIDAFRARHNIAETRFGREATGEPALLSTLRAGRDPSIGTLRRLFAYMAGVDAKAACHNEVDTAAPQQLSPGNDAAFSPSNAGASA